MKTRRTRLVSPGETKGEREQLLHRNTLEKGLSIEEVRELYVCKNKIGTKTEWIHNCP